MKKMATPNFYQNNVHVVFEELLNKTLDKASVNYIYNHEIENTKKLIRGQEMRKGSIFDVEGEIDEAIAKLNGDIEILKTKHEEALKQVEKWTMSETDKKMAKAIDEAKGDKIAIATAMLEWWQYYGISCPVDYAYQTITLVGLNKDNGGKKIVENACSGKIVELSVNKKGTAFVKSALKVWATDAIRCGSIKPQAMSDACMRAYANNLAEAEARKAEKKARKKNK